MFSTYGLGASADYIVDDSGAVLFNPDIANRYCWHCGDSKNNTKGGSFYGKCTNANSIGIEICSTNTAYSSSDPANSPKWSFTDAAVRNAVELVKQLMQEHNVSANRVIRHYDVSGKLCPGISGWNIESGSEAKWLAFKAAIGANTNEPSVKTPIYRVRRWANDSNSQAGAFTVFANAKKLADKLVYNVYDMNGKLVYSSTAKKSVIDIAREVISGKWGNGSERVNRLTAAGYDAAAVQAKVNEILS